MLSLRTRSLREALAQEGKAGSNSLFTPADAFCLDQLLARSFLQSTSDLSGRSVLIATEKQLAAAASLVEMDGMARRMVLLPPGTPREYWPGIIELAEIDAIVTDGAPEVEIAARQLGCEVVSWDAARSVPRTDHPVRATEWVLLTSGTTGPPKLVVHTWDTLSAPIAESSAPGKVLWSTFYDIRRYGGLQMFLRAILGGTSMVLSDATESTADFLLRAGKLGVTHISGTPSHWRRALMSCAQAISPEYIRLSGEIADAGILANLKSAYPRARMGHAFASTEAGVAFAVNDGLAGFPVSILDRTPDVEMKVEESSLRIRSNRTAVRYLGNFPLQDAQGFVNTGDLVEARDGRYYFTGRKDGVINVGGAKVHPEEVEAVINRHPCVRMSLVRPKKSPVTGAIVIAEVVLDPTSNSASSETKLQILRICRDSLAPYKIPASIQFVPSLPVSASGKILRCATSS